MPAPVDQAGMGHDYDIVVIGSGPAGQKAAIQASKLGKRACMIERRHMVGGVCANTGTIPSKTLREAVLQLAAGRGRHAVRIEDLFARTQSVIGREIEVVHDQLARNGVDLLAGDARFVDLHTLSIESGGEGRRVSGEFVVIATGTHPAHPEAVEFDGRTVLDSDGILELDRIPKGLLVVGGGVIGIEYASIFASLGTKVTVVEARDRLLEFCDRQISEALQYHLRELGVVFRFGETVTSVEAREGGTITHLHSGKRIVSDVVLYSAGRQGATDELDLERAGLAADERGRIAVGPGYRTEVPHVFAVGDVIGFPSLAATSMEQGRLAACHAFGVPAAPLTGNVPIGIYAIPEISFVGKTEEELTAAAIAYEVGVARYRELARGQIIGDSHGMLKLLVDPESGRLLGVHVFGTGATELVHIGQAVMGLDGGVGYLVDTVFNYPTLTESYKVAALDATNKIRALTRIERAEPLRRAQAA